MKNKGITLMALTATIVIMLFLLGVTFGAINGGLFENAGKAKRESYYSEIKASIKEAYIMAKGNTRTSKVSEQTMQKEIDREFPDEDAQVSDEGDRLVVVIDNKYYEVDNNGGVTGPGKLEPIENAGDITKGGTCTGTQATPYRIECIEDLVELSKNAINVTKYKNKYIVLVKNLDFNSIFSYSDYRAKYSYDQNLNAYVPDENATTTIKELCTTGQGFIPITLEYGNSGETAFAGTFYGEEQREIKNIYINRNGNAAFFGAGANVKIRNITITGHIISRDGNAAGFIGTAYGPSTINKCYNKAKIEGETGAAGIFSGGAANITECGNEGEIIAINGAAAGIARSNASMYKCYNKGNVTSINQSASGIRGASTSAAVINSCYNSGNITSGTGICTASGITTWTTGNGINNCYNTGKITGACNSKGSSRYGIGSICPTATNYVLDVKNCYSSGLLEITNGTSKSGSALLVARK